MNIDYHFTTGMPSYSWIVPVFTVVSFVVVRICGRNSRTSIFMWTVPLTLLLLTLFLPTLAVVGVPQTDGTTMVRAIQNTYKVTHVHVNNQPQYGDTLHTYQLSITDTNNTPYTCTFQSIDTHTTMITFPEIQEVRQVHGRLLCNDNAVKLQHK